MIVRTSFLPAVMVPVLLLNAIPSRIVMATDTFVPLAPDQVQVGGEIGRRIDVTVNNNLLVLNAEKDFLASFRTKAAKNGYIGLGKLIDSAVRFAAYTKNEQVIALKKRLIEETIRTQGPDGYIGRLATADRMWTPWDIHEMSYVILGLTSDGRYFGEKRSLEAAGKLADYILQRWATMPANWPQRTGTATYVMVTGLECAMSALYRETGDRRYVGFCVQERALPEWDLGIVIGWRKLIEGHVYAYLARCLAQLELYRLQPGERLLWQTQRAMHFLTAKDGTTITGAAGQWEIWTDDQDGRRGLGETCTTAYQLRVYDSLLRLEGNSRYGDLMERTIYNTLFAAQSPDGRRIRYYTPLEGDRAYWPADTMCCPNNFRSIVADLPTMVYYESRPGLAVNLYTPSEATIHLEDNVSVRVRQETDYPASGRVVIHFDPSQPISFPLRLRIPRWCSKASAAINGQPWEKPIALGEFLCIEREWNVGDQVTLNMPMTWRLVLGRKRQSGRAAVMRGPVVFCLNPTQNALLQKRDAADLGYIMIDPVSLKDSPDEDVVRPGGIACAVRVKVSNETTLPGLSNNTSLRLTEFPDPGGKCVYFRLPDLSAAMPDELYSNEGQSGRDFPRK